MNTEPLKLLSSMATRELLEALAMSYSIQGGDAVVPESAGGVDVATRVQGGEVADVVVLSRSAIDKLAAAGRLDPGSVTDLVRSGVATAVRAGEPAPDVSSEAAVRQAVLAADSISFSTGPSGVHLEKVFERWGILEQIRPRIVVPPPGTPVGSLIAAGRAQLGFQQLSELMNLAGIQVLGPLPDAIQIITTFTAAVVSASRSPQRAARLVQYLAAAENAAIKQRFGMEAA